MATVVINPAAVDQCVREADEWRAWCDEIGRRGAEYAQGIAPVLTGNYMRNIAAEVTQTTSPEGVQGAAAVQITANADYSIYVEYRRPRRYLILRHTLEAIDTWAGE